MTWNKRESENNLKTTPERGNSSHFGLRNAVVVLIALGLFAGVICVLTIGRNEHKVSKGPASGPTRIAEVKPRIPRSEKAETALSPEEEAKEREKAEKRAITKRRQQKLKEIREKDTRTKASSPYRIFSHDSENKIAFLLTLEPGTMLLVPPRYDERFEKDFLESCKEPIIVREDDSEYDRKLKRDMIDCKIEICNRMADGEKLADILKESYLGLQKLGRIKDDVVRMTRKELRENAKTATDVELTIEAANKLLEDKGIAPIKETLLLRRTFSRMAEQKSDQLTSPNTNN